MNYYNPTLQTKFNEKGNCLQAVIATLYDVNIDEIPYFDNHSTDWLHAMSEWFSLKFHKYVVSIELSDIEHITLFMDSLIITTINSNNPHPDVNRHAVITKGSFIIFDPMFGSMKKPLTKSMEPYFLMISDIKEIIE